jgi:hypothetical protein
MDEIVIDDEYIERVSAEFSRWAFFLNIVIGFTSFTFALACLGTQNPSFNAWLSLGVVAAIYFSGINLFPGEIRKLRALAKTSKKARIVLFGLRKEFQSPLKFAVRHTVFYLGLGYLLIVAFCPLLSAELQKIGLGSLPCG